MTTTIGGGTWSIISDIGSVISNAGVVTLGVNHSPTPAIDTIIYDGLPCPDTITVSTFDNENPMISCPGNTVLNADANCEGQFTDYTGLATVSDNCSAVNEITITQSPAVSSHRSIRRQYHDINGNGFGRKYANLFIHCDRQ